MKSKVIFLFSVFVALVASSCGDELEKAVDCVSESVFITLKHTTDATNAKTINYEVSNTGSTYTISSIKWTFGDGKTETVEGTTVSHTYTTAGTYTVQADVTVKKGGNSCTSSPTRSITVN